MKARRIQGEYLKVVCQLMGQLNQCDVFRTAEGNGNVVVLRQSGLEDSLGLAPSSSACNCAMSVI